MTLTTHAPLPAMTTLKLSLFALTLLATFIGMQSAHAAVQWKWMDAQGKTQYSDQPPPMDVPESKILKRPRTTVAAPRSEAKTAPSPETSKPSTASVDSELTKKKKAQDAQEEAQRQAEEAKRAQARASSCEKARKYDRALSQGYRVSRVNAKGEREFLDEKGLAEEATNTRQIMSSNCD